MQATNGKKQTGFELIFTIYGISSQQLFDWSIKKHKRSQAQALDGVEIIKQNCCMLTNQRGAYSFATNTAIRLTKLNTRVRFLFSACGGHSSCFCLHFLMSALIHLITRNAQSQLLWNMKCNTFYKIVLKFSSENIILSFGHTCVISVRRPYRTADHSCNASRFSSVRNQDRTLKTIVVIPISLLVSTNKIEPQTIAVMLINLLACKDSTYVCPVCTYAIYNILFNSA